MHHSLKLDWSIIQEGVKGFRNLLITFLPELCPWGEGAASGAMLAARSSGGGISGAHQPPHVHRKHSVASLSGARAHRSNSQDAKRSFSSGKQGPQHRHKAALIREMETSWYLKMFGLSKEETVAQKTGMPYRSVKPCEWVWDKRSLNNLHEAVLVQTVRWPNVSCKAKSFGPMDKFIS